MNTAFRNRAKQRQVTALKDSLSFARWAAARLIALLMQPQANLIRALVQVQPMSLPTANVFYADHPISTA